VALLEMEQFKGPHTRLNLAAVIWQVFERYNLVRKVCYFPIDTATYNDAAVRELAPYGEAVSIGFDPICSQICCFEYMITLWSKNSCWGQIQRLLKRG